MKRFQSSQVDTYQLPAKCFLCGQQNVVETSQCSHCNAPIEISRCAETKSKSPNPPKVIATLGINGSGKTMYLGMLLDLLSRQRERTQFAPCGSGAIEIQQETIAALAEREFPSETPSDPREWRWAHCRVSRRTRRDPHEVFIVDVSGETLVSELENPGQVNLFNGLFRRSFGVFHCVDSELVVHGDKHEEFYALRLINYFNEIRSKKRSSEIRSRRSHRAVRRPSPPIAIVLTKTDQCPQAADNATAFVRRHMPKLWDTCQQLSNPVEFFGASVVGQVGFRRLPSGKNKQVPLRVEPRGIIEPFRWLLGHSTGS